jgi:arabinan endo-1,5-alpha-L-arabinosidase
VRAHAFAALLTLSVLAPLPPANAAEGTIDCPDDQRCGFPSPAECADGNHTGAWDGGPPGRGSICVGAAGHVAAYAGGEPTQLCGEVIVADFNVINGPTTHAPSDPNFCPYFGWPTEVHDPAVAKHDNGYYLFGTGPGIPIWRSRDLRTWIPAGRVFSGNLPKWASTTIPGTQIPWAPDVSFFARRWHIYYAISTFGSKRSAIGVATSTDLVHWTDHGVVIESSEATDYNAIDPNVFVDPEGQPWLDFGSFNSGIKLVQLDAKTGKPSQPTLTPIASRIVPTWGIEAPFVIERNGYHYLFTSFDNCCRGAQSTYNIRVGRSASLEGPYMDDQGVPMLLGGGRLVLEGKGARRGPGHNAVLHDGKRWLLFFHYYDAEHKGTAKLGIIPLRWSTDGWPVADWSALQPTKVIRHR